MGELALQRGVYWPPVEEIPAVSVVAALPHEQWTLKRYNKWLAGVVMGQTIELVDDSETLETTPVISLRERLQKTKEGDAEAEQSSRNNISTATFETIFKSGHITRIESEITADGSWTQYGQSYDAVHRNALQHVQSPAMQPRYETEALNWHRMTDCARAGLLESNYFAELSLAADDQSAVEIEANFFAPTLSLCARLTSTSGGKVVVTESAFLGGMKPFDADPYASQADNLQGLEQAMAQRYDIDAVRNMYTKWGIANAQELSVNELLATPVLIPKIQMPLGVSDLARQYDHEVGRNTFFGGDHEPQDYDTFAAVCAAREQKYTEITDNVLRDLLAEVSSFTEDFQANQCMQDLVEKYAGLRATKDTDIDLRNFGAVSMQHFESARVAYSSGNMEAYALHATVALAQAVTSACGIRSTAKGGSTGSDILDSLRDLLVPPQGGTPAQESYSGTEKDSVMKCVKCPLCKRDGVDASIKIQHAEKKKVITCSSCKKSKEYDLAA